MELTDDFIRYGTIGGAYAGSPNEIASLFKEGNLKQKIDEPLILTYLNGSKEKWSKALDYIQYYIDLFRQWAYRRADGDKQLLQEIDNYIDSLYEWLKQGKEKGQLDGIELTRLKAQKQSLTDKLYDYIPERLISGGQESIDRLIYDIENSEHITKYPPRPSEKWYNAEIERLSLLSEKIKLLMRLVKKIHPENANKYDYLHYLDKITGDIAGYVGVLEQNRDELYASVVKGRIDIEKHLSKIDRSIDETSRDIKRHFSELKERIAARKVPKADTEQPARSGKVEDKKEPAETEQKAKRILVPIAISLILIILFVLLVHKLPVTYVINHPRSYGIQGSIICLIPCLIFGFFKPTWQKWCWGTAAIAFLVGLLSLL